MVMSSLKSSFEYDMGVTSPSVASSPARRSKLRDVRQRLLIWRAVAMAIAFIALLLIICKLNSICKEIKFLQFIQSEFLPKSNSSSSSVNSITSSSSSLPKSQAVKLEALRHDLDFFIFELWSARNALILGMVFVIAYIFSWLWITYQLQLNYGLSLKRVLLLVIFAAVDIAASTGFIMVRLIMVSDVVSCLYFSVVSLSRLFLNMLYNML